MKKGDWGLREEWEDVEKVLQRILPVYNQTNRIISLGQDEKYRRLGLQATTRPGDLILDAGCGPGNMSQQALAITQDRSSIVLLDPLLSMLTAARRRLPPSMTMPVRGLFEHLPFKTGAFSAIITGFAIRDSRDMKTALSEIGRVAANDGGRFLSVDLGKPDSRIARWRVALFLRIVAPLLAVLYLGRMGLFYQSIYRTYRRYPQNHELREYIQTLFKNIKIQTRANGAVAILTASEPLRAPS